MVLEAAFEIADAIAIPLGHYQGLVGRRAVRPQFDEQVSLGQMSAEQAGFWQLAGAIGQERVERIFQLRCWPGKDAVGVLFYRFDRGIDGQMA